MNTMYDYEREDFAENYLEIVITNVVDNNRQLLRDSYEKNGREVGVKKLSNIALDRNWYPHIIYIDDEGYVACELGIEVKECRMYVDENTGEVLCSNPELLDRVLNDEHTMYMTKAEYDRLKAGLRMRCFATVNHPSTIYTDDNYHNRFDSPAKLRNSVNRVVEKAEADKKKRADSKKNKLESTYEFKKNEGTRKNPEWVIAILTVEEAKAIWGMHWKKHIV